MEQSEFNILHQEKHKYITKAFRRGFIQKITKMDIVIKSTFIIIVSSSYEVLVKCVWVLKFTFTFSSRCSRETPKYFGLLITKH